MFSPLRRNNPQAYDWAKSQGYEIQPDGTYKKDLGYGRYETVREADLLGRFESRNYLRQASALPTNTPNYLAQIQQYLNPQAAGLSSAQQSLQGYGSAAEAGRGAYTNPYEDRLVQLMNNPDSISDTNAYRFRFNQGQQALERSAASRGMLNSGNTLAALADYGQGAASQEYGNEFNRLSSAVGQRNQYNLGRMSSSNQELGLRQQGYQDQAGTCLLYTSRCV